MSSTETVTRYAIARGTTPINDATYLNLDDTNAALSNAVETEKSIGIEPDVQIVTIDYVTTIGDPVVYVAPTVDETPAVDETAAPDPTTVVDTTPPADGTVTTSDDSSTPAV